MFKGVHGYSYNLVCKAIIFGVSHIICNYVTLDKLLKENGSRIVVSKYRIVIN